MKTDKYKVAMYIRLSKEDDNEKDESNSIINQRELLKSFMRSKEELNKADLLEFSDDGYSGTNFERPGFTKLLEQVKTGKINCIIVKDFSRFGRNYIELGNYLEQVFPFLGIRFISINDGYDSNIYNGSVAGLDVAFKNLIYDLYSKDLSSKVSSALKTKKTKGQFVGAVAAYGYTKSSATKNKLEKDEEAAVVVKRIFDMADQGMGRTEIAKILNSEQVPSPSSYLRNMNKNQMWKTLNNETYWSAKAITRILKNITYTGSVVNGKYAVREIGSTSKKLISKEKWIIVDDMHVPIVSKEIFDRVQLTFQGDFTTQRVGENKFLLTGKAICGHCNHSMERRFGRNQGNPYYQCGYHRFVPDNTCSLDHISVHSLEETVLISIQNQARLANQASKIITNKIKDYSAGKYIIQLQKIDKTLEELQFSKVKLYEDFVLKLISKMDYMQRREEVNRQMEELNNSKVSIEGEISIREDGDRSNKYVEEFGKFEYIDELTKDVVDNLLDKILVYDKEHIEIVWNYLDDYEKVLNALAIKYEHID